MDWVNCYIASTSNACWRLLIDHNAMRQQSSCRVLKHGFNSYTESNYTVIDPIIRGYFEVCDFFKLCATISAAAGQSVLLFQNPQ